TSLGEVAKIITGPFGTQLHKSDYVDSGVAVIMPQNIGSRQVNYEKISYISEEFATTLRRYKVLKNDIVFARRGDVEKHAFITESEEGELCGTGCFLVRFTSEHVLPEFISLILSTPFVKKWLVLNAVGSNMPNLNTEILKNVPIKFPDLSTQQKILSTISSVEYKIRINTKINTNLLDMAKAIYMHSFFGKHENAKISDILLENSKSNIQVGEAREARGDYPFFTSGETIYEWDNYLVKDRNIYLNTGGNADVKFYIGKAAYSTDTWCISAKNDFTDYLYLFLDAIRPELNQKFFQGTGLKHLQKALVKDKEIYLPSKEILTEFNSIVKPMMEQVSFNTRNNQYLSDLRDWLLLVLMNELATIE
ncbi:hypothetical protein HFM74_002849, partial [Listeria monocytogenes]|nr:hypothetical protein [Listeria monocytogenes]